MMKTPKRILSTIAAVCLIFTMTAPVYAYEAINGPTGVISYVKGEAYEGYTLFSPQVNSTDTYLIDMEGNIVHTWKGDSHFGSYAELLPNGNLLRAGTVPQKRELGECWFGGAGGILQELDWDSKVVWEYKLWTKGKEVQHHTFHRMPNGNTLLLAWEYMSKEEAIKKGRDPKTIPNMSRAQGVPHDGFWNDFVREVDHSGKTVWEWHASDHIGKGPKKLDFNYTLPRPVGDSYSTLDWSHFNSVNYIPATDTVVLNSRNFSEFYFINHKTGKIEYRWGNPTTYDPKVKKPSWYDNGSQRVFGSHCAIPLENGHILLFDNGSERPEARRSAAVEVDPKTGKIVWEYTTKHSNSFFSYRQGGVQRLENGNTLICSTHGGHVFEVTPAKKVVWEFISPFHAGQQLCVVGDANALPPQAEMNTMTNMIHRAFRYGPDFSGLKGRDLSPKGYISGDDCPPFFSAFKRGSTLGGNGEENEDSAEETEEKDGPTMQSY